MSTVLKDLPRDELIDRAREYLLAMGKGYIYFKYTCEKCGARCTLADPNTLYEEGECHACGHETKITKGGFLYSSERL